MSGDGHLLANGSLSGHNDVANVSFASIAEQDGEPSSRAGSKSSSRRSRGSYKEHKHWATSVEESTTPGSGGRKTNKDIGEEHESRRHRIRNSGGFLLESVLGDGSPPDTHQRGKRKAHDSPLQVDKRRSASNRLSAESSMRSSPLSNELSMDGPADELGGQRRRGSRPQTMDPAQLVQMALNLSESRRRQVSNTLQVPLQPGRRVSASYGNTRSASSGSKRGSGIEDSLGRSSPISDQSGRYGSPIELAQDNVVHTFSPATLARAEKVRKYFELQSEYRRLLNHLPPLKPNPDAPGNYTFASKSSPGSAFPEITRIATNNDEKHELGRPYNPIQSLRNRRVRIRERRPFTAPPETWQDVDQVSRWVNDVEAATEHDQYQANGDKVTLPPYEAEHESLTSAQPAARGHRKTDTATSVITRPENSWTIEPTELLADSYWSEKGDNKYYIETRRGLPIFTQPPRKSVDTPKISIEMHRDRVDATDGDTTASESDEAPRHNRKRRLVLPLNRSRATEKRKHRRMLSRSSSESSDDSQASAKARRLRKHRTSLDRDVAPLERHMQVLIDRDARGELSSPDVVSPDHWDSQHTQFATARHSIDRVQRSSLDRANGRASLEVPRPDHGRSKSADGRMGSLDKSVSRTSTLDSEPSTPIANGPTAALDLAPPYNNRDSERGQGARLPVFRSHSKERRGIDRTDFADPIGPDLYTIPSADSHKPRSSMESSRPHIFSRHRTNESIDKKMQRQDTDSTNNSIKEGGSTVGRFLKGRRDRIGGLVVDRFRGRDRAGTAGTYEATHGASDMSDIEDSRLTHGQLKKRATDPSSADVSPRGSFERGRPKPKFHLSGLPSFTSAARDKRTQGDIRGGASGRQTGRQEHQSGASTERLGPPKINVAQASDSEAEPAGGRIKWAKGYGELESRDSSAVRAAINGPSGAMKQRQRHWSIYDKIQPANAENINSRDIARVRALLLASGIKAREIQRRADHPRDETPQFLLDASSIAGQPIADPQPLKDEHMFATNMLSNHLTASFTSFENALAAFQSSTVKKLTNDTAALHSKATDQLSKQTHEASDEADAFVVELTTRAPQNTKQVMDAVDEILRRRRRQWRLLIWVGFKVLEWLLLGIMWGIWAVVMMLNMVKGTVRGVGRGVRWLLVF